MPKKVIYLIPGGGKPKPCARCQARDSFIVELYKALAEYISRWIR